MLCAVSLFSLLDLRNCTASGIPVTGLVVFHASRNEILRCEFKIKANLPSIHFPDLAKIYVDDLSYAGTHGLAYRSYGIDSLRGAVVVVRPDQRK